MSASKLEEGLLRQIRDAGLWEPEREYRFAREVGRQWRFDLAWPKFRRAVEIDGGTWSAGRHSSGLGAENDAVKAAVALLLGWQVVRVTNHMVEDGRALWMVKGLFGATGMCYAARLALWKCHRCDEASTRRRRRARQKSREEGENLS